MSILINAINIDPNKYYVVALDQRWGSKAYTTAIEYRYFPPSKPDLNEKFEISVIDCKNLPFYVMSVPRAFEKTAKKVARQFGMKVCDGTPTLHHQSIVKQFPLQGSNVWTLENRERHFYHQTPYITEDQECKNIRKGGQAITFQ